MSTAGPPELESDGALTARLRADVQARDFEGELILLDPASGEYFALRGVGRELVQGLEKGLTVAEVTRALHADYEVEWRTLCDDVTQLVRELLSRRLMVRSESRPGVEATT